MMRLPAIALRLISRVRTVLSSSTAGSAPSSLSDKRPFFIPLSSTAELGFVFRFCPSGSSPKRNPFVVPLEPFACAKAETLAKAIFQRTTIRDCKDGKAPR